MSDIFIKFGEGGGSRQVESQPFVHRLRAGDVLNYTQRSGLLGCILDLQVNKEKDINIIFLLVCFPMKS